MQLLAACQQAPDLRKLVVKSSVVGLRRLQPRPGDVHRGHGRQAPARERLRQGRHRGRVLRPRLRPSPSRRRRHHAAVRQRDRPPDHLGDDRLLPDAGHPDRARVQPAAPVRPRGRRARRAPARRDGRGHRHLQRRRRRRHHAEPGRAPSRPADRPAPAFAVSSVRLGDPADAGGRLLPRAGGVPDLRAGPGHHPDAQRAPSRAEVQHRRGLRRLRRLGHARTDQRRPGAGHRGRPRRRPVAHGEPPSITGGEPRG